MTDDQNEILVDSNNLQQDEVSISKKNCSKKCGKEYWDHGNKIQRAQTDYQCHNMAFKTSLKT